MLEPVPTNIDRARVRLGDLGAAWLLVALILLGSALSGTFSAAATEAVHAASARNCCSGYIGHRRCRADYRRIAVPAI